MLDAEEIARWCVEVEAYYYCLEQNERMMPLKARYTYAKSVWHKRADMVRSMAQGWEPIEEAPVGKTMFVAISIRDEYVSDPWCVWQDKKGYFVRWPHKFSPTHWMPLPSSSSSMARAVPS